MSISPEKNPENSRASAVPGRKVEMDTENSAIRKIAPALPLLPGPLLPKTPQLISVQYNTVKAGSSGTTFTNIPRVLVAINPELCKGCELCVYACPSGNLSMSTSLNRNGYHPAIFSYDGTRGPCSACGICYWICPDMAISEIGRLKQ